MNSYDEAKNLEEALAFHANGHLESAQALYLQVLDNNPNCFDALNFLGLIKNQKKQWSEALELFKRAIGLYSSNPDFYINLATSLRELNRLDDALMVLNEAAKISPNYSAVYTNIGILKLRAQDYEGALSAINQAQEMGDQTLATILHKCDVYRVRGHYEQALNALQSALVQHQGNAQLHLSIGLIYEDLKDLESALKSYATATSLQENFSTAIFNSANVLQKLGQLESAIAQYDVFISLDAAFAPAFMNKGTALLGTGRVHEAKDCFELACQLEPENAVAYSNLGVALFESAMLLESLAAYEKAICYKRNYPEAYSNQGNVLKALRKYEAAIASYDVAISLNENYFEAYSNRGVVYFELDQLDKALSDYEKAISIDSSYAQVYSNRANIYKEKGDLHTAGQDLLRALQIKYEQLKSNKLLPQLSVSKPMVVAQASKTLIDLKAILDRCGFEFFLAYGTLLGIYRDGEILPHDKDLDVGLAWDTPREDLLKALSSSGRYWVDSKSANAQRYDFNFGVIDKKTGISIDFFFFKPEGSCLLSGFYHLPNPLLWRFSAFELAQISYKDLSFQVPMNPENFLIEIYGAQWRIPDPYFDSLVSGHNLVESAKPISLIYAYSRLFELLTEHNWKKAYGYCKQISALCKADTNPLIVSISALLEANI